MIEMICGLAQNIKWPADLESTQEDFRAIAGFPGVVGSIDDSHFKICPSADRHNEYADRTWKYNATLLVVCDVKKKFTGIVAGFAGSIHDQR